MAKYRAKVHITHDDKYYAPGDELSMTGDDAERLVSVGAVETVAEAKAAAKKDDEK